VPISLPIPANVFIPSELSTDQQTIKAINDLNPCPMRMKMNSSSPET